MSNWPESIVTEARAKFRQRFLGRNFQDLAPVLVFDLANVIKRLQYLYEKDGSPPQELMPQELSEALTMRFQELLGTMRRRSPDKHSERLVAVAEEVFDELGYYPSEP